MSLYCTELRVTRIKLHNKDTHASKKMINELTGALLPIIECYAKVFDQQVPKHALVSARLYPYLVVSHLFLNQRASGQTMACSLVYRSCYLDGNLVVDLAIVVKIRIISVL